MSYKQYQRMCGRKRAFATEAAAEKWGRKFNDQRPYECPCCGKWHLTSRKLPDEGVRP